MELEELEKKIDDNKRIKENSLAMELLQDARRTNKRMFIIIITILTLRSISCATGKSWDYVYDILSDEAQEQGTMMDSSQFIQNYLDERYERLPYVRGTVGEISGLFPDHILLISMRNHIVCSRYGIIYDTFDCRNRQAEFVWIVK